MVCIWEEGYYDALRPMGEMLTMPLRNSMKVPLRWGRKVSYIVTSTFGESQRKKRRGAT